MALKVVAGKGRAFNGTRFVQASKMQTNETVQGYFAGYTTGKYNDNLIALQDEDGNTINVTMTGSLRYLPTDADLQIGAFTVITKTGSRPSKRDASKEVGQYSVAQDTDNVIEVTAATAAPKAEMETAQARLERAKSKAKAS